MWCGMIHRVRAHTSHEHHDSDEDDSPLAKKEVGHGRGHRPRGHLRCRQGQVQGKSCQAQRGCQGVWHSKPEQATKNVTPACMSPRNLFDPDHEADV
jgi:hypothetical protein